MVAFGQHSFVFTPACCEPDLNASLDSLQGSTSSEAASSTSSGKSSDESDSNDDYGGWKSSFSVLIINLSHVNFF